MPSENKSARKLLSKKFLQHHREKPKRERDDIQVIKVVSQLESGIDRA